MPAMASSCPGPVAAATCLVQLLGSEGRVSAKEEPPKYFLGIFQIGTEKIRASPSPTCIRSRDTRDSPSVGAGLVSMGPEFSFPCRKLGSLPENILNLTQISTL